jgi:hypothetical protein
VSARHATQEGTALKRASQHQTVFAMPATIALKELTLLHLQMAPPGTFAPRVNTASRERNCLRVALLESSTVELVKRQPQIALLALQESIAAEITQRILVRPLETVLMATIVPRDPLFLIRISLSQVSSQRPEQVRSQHA